MEWILERKVVIGEDSDEAIAVEDGVITSGSIEDWDESWGVEVEDCVRRSGSIEDADE